MIIYRVKNKINNKSYIGQTIKALNSRIKDHNYNVVNGSNYHFHNSLRKYGTHNFTWEVIEKCDSKEELDEMEFHYIMQYDTYNNGYNKTHGGEGTPGWKPSLKRKEQMSKDLKNRWDNPSWKEKMRKLAIEAWKNKDRRKEQSINTKKLWKNVKWKENMMKIRNSTEYKEKKLDGLQKGWNSVERRKKQAELTRKIHSRNWIVISPEGKRMEINNLSKFCRENNLDSSAMSKVAKGKIQKSKGWKCKKVGR